MRSCSNLHKHGHYGVLHFTSHLCEPVQCLEQSLLVLSIADQWQCFNSQNWHKHALLFPAEAAASHTLRIQKIRLSFVSSAEATVASAVRRMPASGCLKRAFYGCYLLQSKLQGATGRTYIGCAAL